MLDKDKIDLILGQDKKENDLDIYRNWMIASKNMGQEEAYNYMTYLSKMLRTNAVYNLTMSEVWRLVSVIRCSKFSKSYQRHLLYALELYLEFKGIKQGCAIKFEKPRATRKNPKYLTHEQMVAFIHGAKDYRDFALAMMFLTTGVRLSELRNLDIGDVDLVNAVIKVRHGKGDKDREIPLSEQCIEALKVYYSHHDLNRAKPYEAAVQVGTGQSLVRTRYTVRGAANR